MKTKQQAFDEDRSEEKFLDAASRINKKVAYASDAKTKLAGIGKAMKEKEPRYIRIQRVGHVLVEKTSPCQKRYQTLCGHQPWDFQTMKVYDTWPDRTRKCPECQAKLAQREQPKPVEAPKADHRPGEVSNDLKEKGVREGDLWEMANGRRFEVNSVGLRYIRVFHLGTDGEVLGEDFWLAIELKDVARFWKLVKRVEPKSESESEPKPEFKPWSVFIRGGGMGHRVWIDGGFEAICGAKPDENAETCNNWPRLPRCPKCENVWNTFIETGKRPEAKPENAFPQRGEVWEMANGRTVKVGRVVGSYIMTEKDEIAINDLKKKVEALKPEVKPEVPVAARAGKTPILLGDTWMDDQGHEFHVCGIWPPKEGRKTVTVCYQYPYTSWETCNSPCGRKQFHKLVSRWSEPVEPPKPESKPSQVPGSDGPKVAPKPDSDLSLKGLKHDDLWEGAGGTRRRIVNLYYDRSGKLLEIEYQHIGETPVYKMAGPDRNSNVFHKLLERDGKPVVFLQAAERAKQVEKPAKPVTVWKQVRVFSRGFSSVHSFLRSPGTTLADTYSLCRESLYRGEQFYDEASMPALWKKDLCEGCEEEWQKLTSPKPAEAKPAKPTDLAMFGLKEGDKWLTNAGVPFVVLWVSKRHTRTLATIQFDYDGKSQTVKNVAKEAHLFAKLVERNGEKVTPKSESATVPAEADLDKFGVDVDDLWRDDDGHEFRLVSKERENGKVVAVNSQSKSEPFVRHLYPLRYGTFHKLVERHGKPTEPPKPEAKVAPKQDVVGKGIAVNDLWQYVSEENNGPLNFRVLCFHDGIAFCATEDRKRNHFMAKPTDKWFQTLLERNGKPVEPVRAKRPDPKSGMDLASFGWQPKDIWRTADGREFKVTGAATDGFLVKSLDIQWQATGKRNLLTELSTLTFHKLIERHGINTEEVKA